MEDKKKIARRMRKARDKERTRKQLEKSKRGFQRSERAKIANLKKEFGDSWADHYRRPNAIVQRLLDSD